MNHRLDLYVMSGSYTVCRLDAGAPLPPWTARGKFCSITRTPNELSVVCEAGAVPPGVQAERGWRALAVRGPLDFNLIGIVAELAGTLARAAISIFVMSTYETDYILVREVDLGRAIGALRAAGHIVVEDDDPEGQREPAVL